MEELENILEHTPDTMYMTAGSYSFDITPNSVSPIVDVLDFTGEIMRYMGERGFTFDREESYDSRGFQLDSAFRNRDKFSPGQYGVGLRGMHEFKRGDDDYRDTLLPEGAIPFKLQISSRGALLYGIDQSGSFRPRHTRCGLAATLGLDMTGMSSIGREPRIGRVFGDHLKALEEYFANHGLTELTMEDSR